MDTFKIVAPGMRDSKKRGVVRVPPTCYDRQTELSDETGVSICRIVDQCVTFALEHMEER